MKTSSRMERDRRKVAQGQGPWSTHPGGTGATDHTLWLPVMPPATSNLLPTLPVAKSGQNLDQPLVITEGSRGRMENDTKSEMTETDTGW